MLTSAFQEHGRLCDLGGFIQDQEEHHEVPRCYGRLRPFVRISYRSLQRAFSLVLGPSTNNPHHLIAAVFVWRRKAASMHCHSIHMKASNWCATRLTLDAYSLHFTANPKFWSAIGLPTTTHMKLFEFAGYGARHQR